MITIRALRLKVADPKGKALCNSQNKLAYLAIELFM